MPQHVPADAIRAAFADAMSRMFRAEAPLYDELIDIVASVNQATLQRRPELRARLEASGELARLDAERHGAIRLGSPAELAAMARVFRVMGMHPVGYYDLSGAGVPVHSTVFRPIERQALTASPFRVFTSLLRPELIADPAVRQRAGEIVDERRIFSERALELATLFEREGGLSAAQAAEFVSEALKTFRWQSRTLVDRETYERLHSAHPLVADIVSFPGPHINHLTPRTLDIDAAQAEMVRRGMQAKAVIEGPPPRRTPILLRQTSFKALGEPVRFRGEDVASGRHTARFGEVEQRGAALTRAGRALYDDLLAEAKAPQASNDAAEPYAERLQTAFHRFPDAPETLRGKGLAFFRYAPTAAGLKAAWQGRTRGGDVETWLEAGWASAEPITYEDFLPVSAAGIFRSNLGGDGPRIEAAAASRPAFEAALQARVYDEFELYEQEQERSRVAVAAALAPEAPHVAVRPA